jgi:serine protease AprX
MKKLFGILLTILLLSQTQAQTTRFIVKFRDKATNPFSLSNPLAFLSQRAIDRRTKYSIAIDSSDLPVTPRYIDSIRLAGTVTILNASKWLNSISIQTTDPAALIKINSFPFVQSVTGIAARFAASNFERKFEDGTRPTLPQLKETSLNSGFYDYGVSVDQIHIHNGEFLHNIGLRGQGMLLGVLDGGFKNYTTVKAFDSARANGQILGVYDFVNKDSSVNEDDVHGMEVLSTIAANIPGQFVGTAPKANFYLFRTENSASEYPIEEHNWVCGAERIDSVGGDVISSSLSYSAGMSNPVFNHINAEMNGNTTMAAIGADLAAKKGLLVVNSAGNEGTGSFHFISTPADGDSVMAVGAITGSGDPANFSSYGPSSDGQTKPDVAALGVSAVVQLSNNTLGVNNGTSLACPIIAGLSTCLWQGFPEFNNMKIITALRKAGSKANNPDDRVGYGIPDVKKAVMNLVDDFASFNVSVSNCTATLQWTSKDVSSMKYIIERGIQGQSSFIKIAERQGTGSVFGNRSYQLFDTLKNIPAGNLIYRVRQIIDTSKSGFTSAYIDSTSVTLAFSCTGPDEVLAIPNPVVQTLTLKLSTLPAVPDLTVNIFNSLGQLMTRMKTSKPAGVYFFDVPLPAYLSAGKCYVRVYDGNRPLVTTEFIKLLQ